MKFRFIIIIVSLSLVLASCSLAEDITPPPGSSGPASIPTTELATQTPEPLATNTNIPTLESVDTITFATPALTDSSTPSVDVSPIDQPAFLVMDGTVSGFSGTGVPSGLNATLWLYSTSGQEKQHLIAPINADGKFEFVDVPADNTAIYLVTIVYKDVTYESNYVQFDGTKFSYDFAVTVFDSSSDVNLLTIAQAHLQFDFSTAGKLQVMALYIISNPGTTSVIINSDGTTIPFIQVPEGAATVQYQLAQSSSPLMMASNGFAILPGSEKQYGIISTFSLPYTDRMEFSQPFSLPVSSATIIVPEGVKVRSDQLKDGGTQASTGTTPTTYHLYQSGSLATGSTLTLTISGKPGDEPGFVLDQRTWLMIGIGSVGLILIGLGIFLFLRDRKLRKLEDEFEGDDDVEEDALGEDRESIMDAIIALDDQFKSGDISKEAYENRRTELKDRLKIIS